MNGRILAKRELVLMAVALAAGLASAKGQERPGADMLDAPASQGPGPEPAPWDPSAAEDPGEPDRARPISDPEKALRKAAAVEAADQTKAAGRPSLNVQGMLQLDAAMFSQDAGSRIQFPKGVDTRNGVAFRRARLGAGGEAFQVVEYRIEMDFANGFKNGTTTLQQTAFKDTWLGGKELPLLGSLRAGHFKEPFGLEQLTRDRFGTFMERSLSDEGALVPGRNVGVMAVDGAESQRATWALGAFIADMPDAPPVFRENNGGAALTGRVSFLPWYDDASEGRGLLHTGAAYSFRANATGGLSYSARPESFLAPTVVSTVGELTGLNGDVRHNQLLGAEAALVYGPISLQAEYYQSFVDRTDHADVQFNGGYAFLSLFLTGEHRPYNRLNGTFDRVRPLENFFRARTDGQVVATGKGAWEIAYRYSLLDLDDGLVQGGLVRDHTIGLNWYLNPFTRVDWNYVNSHVVRDRHGVREGNIHIFQMRAAIDF